MTLLPLTIPQTRPRGKCSRNPLSMIRTASGTNLEEFINLTVTCCWLGPSSPFIKDPQSPSVWNTCCILACQVRYTKPAGYYAFFDCIERTLLDGAFVRSSVAKYLRIHPESFSPLLPSRIFIHLRVLPFDRTFRSVVPRFANPGYPGYSFKRDRVPLFPIHVSHPFFLLHPPRDSRPSTTPPSTGGLVPHSVSIPNKAILLGELVRVYLLLVTVPHAPTNQSTILFPQKPR